MNHEVENFLKDIGAGANYLGHEVYIVGGFVRNEIILGQENPGKQDIDLVINTDAIQFIEQFQKYYEDNDPEHLTFKILERFGQFGTIKISLPRDPDFVIEIASSRTEHYPEPACFPKVEIINDIEQDLPRRDFTINALLKSLNRNNFGEIIDHVNGIDDINKRLIRVFHSESFVDDPTRIPRAIRFALEYGFQIEENTLEYMYQACKDSEFESWLKKRANRFEIETNRITELLPPSKVRA